jgi:hypothetical protein
MCEIQIIFFITTSYVDVLKNEDTKLDDYKGKALIHTKGS